MAHETMSKTNEGRVSVSTTLTEMIDEAMATATRLNAILDRIEKTLGEPKKRVRYFGYDPDSPIWRENANGSISVKRAGSWLKSSFRNFSDLAEGNRSMIEIQATEGVS